MPFHMISQPTYNIRTVPCGAECSSDCIDNDPREHRQDYATALCGLEVVRHRDEYCNVDIANPQWEHDWCVECVCRTIWTEEEIQVLHDKGLLEGREATEAAMRFLTLTGAMPEEKRDQAWAEALHHARLVQWMIFTPELAKWLRQLVEHIDDNGPRPEYWPVNPSSNTWE